MKKIEITPKQAYQFNKMLDALNRIGKQYQTPKQLRKSADVIFGLGYQESLEMAYENLQLEARMGMKGIKPINLIPSNK